MKHSFVLTSIFALSMPFIGAMPQASAQDTGQDTANTAGQKAGQSPQDAFDAKHKTCLDRIADDPDVAFEEAMIWRGDGGGRRAKHCEAMALFAVGHKEEAAYRLDKLAKAPDGGTEDMRADYYSEAANFWLVANLPKEAYASATAGIELRQSHIPLRIARARAYALMGRYDYAETDLTSALVFDRDNAAVLRYRADARRNMGQLEAAKADIDKAMMSDPTSVETALVRGEIIEALRKRAVGDVSR